MLPGMFKSIDKIKLMTAKKKKVKCVCVCVCVCVCAASTELTFAGKALFVYRIHLYFIILLLKANHLVRMVIKSSSLMIM